MNYDVIASRVEALMKNEKLSYGSAHALALAEAKIPRYAQANVWNRAHRIAKMRQIDLAAAYLVAAESAPGTTREAPLSAPEKRALEIQRIMLESRCGYAAACEKIEATEQLATINRKLGGRR